MRNNKSFIGIVIFFFFVSILFVKAQQKPNILFIISDDQGYPHTSAYGSKLVNTPTFDKIAEEGILFNNFFVAAPHCSPSRASILTGRYIWQNGPAGTHWSTFPADLVTYTELLEEYGFKVGYTGKGWAPGNWIDGEGVRNPAGVKYINTENANEYINSRPASGISEENYVASFELFLSKVEEDQPFCFWMGGWEPHLPYEKGSGLKNGKKLNSVVVPPYLPNNDTVKGDLLDYALEIEWFDKQAGKAIKLLEEREMLDNTIVVFTSDNGMPFPRAKAFAFEDGNHVPLAVMWRDKIINPGRRTKDLVSAVDIFPTFLDVVGLKDMHLDIQGKSLIPIFKDEKSNDTEVFRKYIYWGRERHGSARWSDLGYPQRAIRSDRFLYIWNPEYRRYPAGEPKKKQENKLTLDFGDVGVTPTKELMINIQDSLFNLTFRKFPEEMLYDIKKDPYCMNNLAENPKYEKIKGKLVSALKNKLKETRDPRVEKDPNIWETYRRYGPSKNYPIPKETKRILQDQIIIKHN